MAYHSNDQKINLDDVRRRIEETDLIPSRAGLRERIEFKFKILNQHGIHTLADLRKALKNSKQVSLLSVATGLDADYLTLLRREIEGYFPEPPALKSFDWLPMEVIHKIERYGLKDGAAFFQAAGDTGTGALAQLTGVDVNIIEFLYQLIDLTRVQWVSLTFARVLAETGIKGASQLAGADPAVLYKAILQANEGSRFYKGKVGLRDIQRLIMAAGYLDEEKPHS